MVPAIKRLGWKPPAVALLAFAAALTVVISCGDDGGEDDAGVDAGDGGEDGGDDGGEDAGEDGGPAPDDSPNKGPWVMQTGTTGALVRWESELEPPRVAVEYEPEAGGEARTAEGSARATEVTASYGEDGAPIIEQPDLAGTYWINDVAIDGLEPATCYTYTVVDHPDSGGRFCTMHEATDHDTPITFIGLGDTSPGLGTTADIVAHLIDDDPEFTVHVGDVQYYSAVVETWELWFDEMQPLLSQGALFPIIGNHEDELEGTEFEDYYERFWDAPSSDGNTFAYHYETGGVHFFGLNSEDDIGPPEAWEPQFEWLDTRMTEVESEPGFRFSVLYFHRAVYTLADHSPSVSLRSRVEPLVEAHTVPLVLQGHAHVYERFEVGETTYLVIGGGGSGLDGDIDGGVSERPDEESLRVAKGRYHHGALFRVAGGTISVQIVDDEGTVRDDFEIAIP